MRIIKTIGYEYVADSIVKYLNFTAQNLPSVHLFSTMSCSMVSILLGSRLMWNIFHIYICLRGLLSSVYTQLTLSKLGRYSSIQSPSENTVDRFSKHRAMLEIWNGKQTRPRLQTALINFQQYFCAELKISAKNQKTASKGCEFVWIEFLL